MKSMFKNVLMVTLLFSASSVFCGQILQENAAQYWVQPKTALEPMLESVKAISNQGVNFASGKTPDCIAKTFAFLAEMPKFVEGESLCGYATVGNAQNVLAEVGAAAVLAAAAYGIYKVAFKKRNQEIVYSAPICYV